jgi:hypothetical protein
VLLFPFRLDVIVAIASAPFQASLAPTGRHAVGAAKTVPKQQAAISIW